MTDWYSTVGQAHLKEFFNLINRTIRDGKANGLKVKRIDMTDMLRIYRGENMVIDKEKRNYVQSRKLTLEVIKDIHEMAMQGCKYDDIAKKHGISRSYVLQVLQKRLRRYVV